ncbi:MAG: hypothetical protein KIPDCIKN_03055 [Haliscomenobacter sp.]|jgi:CRISPR-associated protein Cmr6|nr:hypothetical protein [Haliscomenobacter sp.]
MPTGTIRIKDENGLKQVWLERDGGQPLYLTGLKPDDKLVDGASCDYQKLGKQLIIKIGGKTYNWNGQTSSKGTSQPSPKTAPVSVNTLLKNSGKEQGYHIPEPKLEDIGQCPKPKQMQGNNLYNFDKQALRLPQDTAGHMRKFDNTGVDNFALALNKSVHFFKIGEKGKVELNHTSNGEASPFLFRQPFDDVSRGKENKEKKKFEIDFSFNAKTINSLLNRQRLMIEQRFTEEWLLDTQTLPIQNRLIHGLGNASVFETAMTLHHVYGIPYLPASSVKGVVRSWVIRNCYWKEEAVDANRSKESEELAMQDPLFAYIFGKDTSGSDKQALQGNIVFFDAFPQSPPVIEPDIMNVHYPKYYGGTWPPVDNDSPNPIPFLTVGKCDANGKPLQFKFYIACKERDVKPEITGDMIDKAGGKLSAQSTVLDVVGFWLTSALTSHGIGAKTAVGYGYFNPQ